MSSQLRGRLGIFFEKSALVLASLLAMLTVVSFMTGGAPLVLARLQQQTPGATPSQTVSTVKTQDDPITSAIETLKQRANAQQSLIGALATITSLYAVILSFAAYFRLQQLKEETKESIEQSAKRFDSR